MIENMGTLLDPLCRWQQV